MTPTVSPDVCPACGEVRLTITEAVRRPGAGLTLGAVVKVICGCPTPR